MQSRLLSISASASTPNSFFLSFSFFSSTSSTRRTGQETGCRPFSIGPIEPRKVTGFFLEIIFLPDVFLFADGCAQRRVCSNRTSVLPHPSFFLPTSFPIFFFLPSSLPPSLPSSLGISVSFPGAHACAHFKCVLILAERDFESRFATFSAKPPCSRERGWQRWGRGRRRGERTGNPKLLTFHVSKLLVLLKA